MKPKVDYEGFMSARKEESSPAEENYQVTDDEYSAPILPPPPKAKSTMGLPIFIALIVFLLLIGSIGLYYGLSSSGSQPSAESSAAPKGSTGEMKKLFTDANFTMYDIPSGTWVPYNAGNIPFSTMILTGNDSRRNIFSINGVHTIRVDKDTKFKIDTLEPSTDFKEKVKMTVVEGNIWVEGVSDVFEATLPTGSLTSDGKDFEIKIKDGATTIYAWKGNLVYDPMESEKKNVEIKEGKMLFIDAKGEMIPPPPGLLAIEKKQSDWQQWNLLVKASDFSSENPTVALIPKEEQVEENFQEQLKTAEKAAPLAKEAEKKAEPVKPQTQTAKGNPPDAKPDIPRIGGDPKYPTKGTYGKKPGTDTQTAGTLPKPKGQGGRPVMDGNAPPPPPDNAQPMTNNMGNPPNMPVHNPGQGNNSGMPVVPGDKNSASSSSSSNSSDYKNDMTVLENKNKGLIRTAPPGFKLNEEPVGPGN